MPLPIKYLPDVQSRIDEEEILKRNKEIKKAKASNSIVSILDRIRNDVEQNYKEKLHLFRVINDYDELKDYILRANKFGKLALDTETTGLDPMTCKIVGFSMYFPGEKSIYVPINHCNYLTNEREPNQLNEEQIRQIFKLLTAKLIFHNAPFDIRVILHNIGIMLKCWWDTQEGAFLLGEEESHTLKDWHGKYISKTKEPDFKELFGDISFQIVPIQYAYPYAASDTLYTYECYELQSKYLNDDEGSRQDRKDLYWVFRNIEMPMVEVIVELEENGIAVDKEYLDKFYKTYHESVEEAKKACNVELELIRDVIDDYKLRNPRCGLSDPINISSPAQLAILFYDILKCKPIDGKSPRSTDDATLNEFAKQYDISVIKSIHAYRKATKITSTYVDKIYDIMDANGRVHTSFRSNGAVTGRMSSKEPINMQNIPSRGKGKEIRLMYTAQTTYQDREAKDNVYQVGLEEEVELANGEWKWAEKLQPGDVLSDQSTVTDVRVEDFTVYITVNEAK